MQLSDQSLSINCVILSRRNRGRKLEAIYGQKSKYYLPPITKTPHSQEKGKFTRWFLSVTHENCRLKDVSSTALTVESWLKWCGMSPRNPGMYQIFLLVFSLFMMLRWFFMILVFVRGWDAKYSWMLGDPTQSTKSFCGRFYFQLNLLGASIPFTIWTMFCLRFGEDSRYSRWLELFDMTSGKIDWQSLHLTRYAAVEFRRFIHPRIKAYRLFRWIVMILVTIACVLLEQDNLMRLATPALLWTPIQVVWCWYTVDVLILPVVTFRCICFYFHLRIDKLCQDGAIILEHLKSGRSIEIASEIVFEFIQELNLIKTDISRYTKFWRFFFLVNYGHLYCSIVGSAILVGWGRGSLGMPVASSIVALIIFLFYVFLFFFSWITTANIANGGHELFLLSNRMSVHKLHPFVVSRMSIMVASMAVKSIGFDCYSFFMVKWPFLYQVLMFTGSTYFVLLDNLLF